MFKRNRSNFIVLLALGLLLVSCGPFAKEATLQSPLPASTFTPIPSFTTTPLLTVTATIEPSITATSEPFGCQRPPDDYTRIEVNGWILNQRTYAMLQHAAELYGGPIDITNSAITQGSYHDNGSASFGTHLGGGAVDISVIKLPEWTVYTDEIEPLIRALRAAGFATWLRDFDEVYDGSPIHIHAIAIGDAELSQAAIDQLTGPNGYFFGFTGFPWKQEPDRHGGPVICQWMIDMGYPDLQK